MSYEDLIETRAAQLRLEIEGLAWEAAKSIGCLPEYCKLGTRGASFRMMVIESFHKHSILTRHHALPWIRSK